MAGFLDFWQQTNLETILKLIASRVPTAHPAQPEPPPLPHLCQAFSHPTTNLIPLPRSFFHFKVLGVFHSLPRPSQVYPDTGTTTHAQP